MRDLKLVVVVLVAVVGIMACGGTASNHTVANNSNSPLVSNSNSTAPAANTMTSPPVSQSDGKELYTENCQICHRNTGKGGPLTVEGKKLKPADLTSGHSRKHSDDDLVKDIQDGDPDEGMPAFKAKLTPEEIKVVVGYIRTLQQR